MNPTMPLRSFIPARGIAIASGYVRGIMHAYVAAYKLEEDNSVSLQFPKGHSFLNTQKVTLHLDNRSGVEEYDADLRVYRTSYKGTVTAANAGVARIIPDEYMVFYSDKCVSEYKANGFTYDQLGSEKRELPRSDMGMDRLNWNPKEHENKLGVLITSMESRPHTSLMAFLSNGDDEVFLITFKGTFKSRLLHRNNFCCFAIDHRSEYNFEKAIDWNYTIIEADAYAIVESDLAFDEIKRHFVEKNPWETSFFLSPEIEMFHLKPRRLLVPECMK